MILSRDQITITDLHDGIDGNTYVLNIIGGTRSVTYNTSGASPSPAQTAFSFELLKNGVAVTPTSIAWSVTGHLTGTGTSATFTPGIASAYSTGNSDSVSLTVVYSNISFKETVPISITKLNAGVDAKIISLNPSGLVFKQDKAGVVTPASITLTSQAQNTSVSTWSYSVNGAAFTTTKPTWLTAPSGGILTITNANMKDNSINSLAVKVADSTGTYFDTVTVVRAIDGTDGSNGANAPNPITAYLTNESTTLAASSTGVVSGLPLAVSEFKVLDGITEVPAASIAFALVQGSLVGATASINASGVITLSALSADSGSAQFAATYGGQTIKKTITFAKSKVGQTGADGRSITSVDVQYYLSTSSTALSGGSWSTTAPTWVDGRFMWSKTVTTYSTGSPTESTPVCITGAKGATGTSGKGISSTDVTYQASSSGTVAPTGTWTTTIPAVAAGQYLWSRTITNYTDSTSSTVYAVGGMGVNGAPGAAGKGISSTVITYQSGSSGTVAPTGTWTSNVPVVAANNYLWTRTVITYTDSSSSTSYSVGLMGAQGPQGNTGATGRGVSSIVEEFYLSTSKTTQTGGSWSTTMPTWSPGKYVWTRSKITYTSGSPATETTTPLVSSEWEAVNEIQVGGRNLLLKSNIGVTNSSYPTQRYDLSEAMVLDQKYTLRLWGTLGAGKTSFTPYLNGGSISLGAMTNNGDGTFSLTFLGKSSGVTTGDFLNIYPMPSGTVVDSSIEKIKLEIGTQATDYTKAPEDIEEELANRPTKDVTDGLAGVIGDLATELANKAGAGELQTLIAAYNARMAEEDLNNQAASAALSNLQGRQAIIDTLMGEHVQKWTFIDTAMTFGEEGIFIGNKDTNMGVLLGTDRISFMDKGTEVAYISNKTMQINHGIFVESARVGSHLIQTIPGTDITVFTYVG